MSCVFCIAVHVFVITLTALPRIRPTCNERAISKYASFWARHVGTAYCDGAAEFPLFVLAVSIAHGRAYEYDTVFTALRLHNQQKPRWDFILPLDDSHGTHPLYFRAVQGHTPVLDAELRPERAIYTSAVAGDSADADLVFHVTWRHNAPSIARTGLQRRDRG